ncbi:MAG: cupin domain-containing protein [Endomicrobium sp.]|jgi:fermentation-respiration switch protein FrsA (DUF1100 family)/quercetin dioxygenase-like cupin family protein/alkylhydroperoxidase/carboxymuconolactone decarboxylase family protein YurZ|nr:cupin domain-containing protein [Endomicrobium sp.]
MRNKTGIITIVIAAIIAAVLPFANSKEQDMNELTARQQSIALISSDIIKGDIDGLNAAFIGGLDNGLSVNEIKEILVQMSAYAGFPRSLNGITAFQNLIEKRKADGIIDMIGNQPVILPAGTDRNKYGADVRTKLVGNSSKGAYAAFVPEIDDFLKEHLFADIFGRGVLTDQERELATIAALSSVEGLGLQLRGHLNIGLNVGLKPKQLQDIISLVGVKSSREVLQDALANSAAAKPEKTKAVSKNKEKVQFKNRIGIVVAGDLYLPSNIDKSKKYAAIVVGHTFTGVKEQTSGLHAQKLAELGFVTLAFDASFWGESGGQPRNIEVPEIRVEDFSAAVDFLSNQPFIDADKIGAIGICGGGGYSIAAAAIDHRIKAVATVSMYDLGRARRQGLGDTIPYEQRMQTLERIGRLRTNEFGGQARTDTFGVPATITAKDSQNTREFYDYYRTPRAQSQNTDTSYSLTSQAPMMNFFPFSQIETISPRPALFIAGERAVSKYFSDTAFSLASEPKELFVVQNASHVDLYDRPQYLKITLPKLADFFNKNLNGKTPPASANNAKIKVMRKADFAKSKGAADKFSGEVEVEYIAGSPEASTGLVSFDKGARTAWHTHPKGQLIVIVSGVGRVQQDGGEITEVRAGDAVWFPAGVKHWHGAAENFAMSHYAITFVRDGIAVNWMELVQ